MPRGRENGIVKRDCAQLSRNVREDDTSGNDGEKNALMITAHYTRRRCSNEL